LRTEDDGTEMSDDHIASKLGAFVAKRLKHMENFDKTTRISQIRRY
jgi:hypothetical protein